MELKVTEGTDLSPSLGSCGGNTWLLSLITPSRWWELLVWAKAHSLFLPRLRSSWLQRACYLPTCLHVWLARIIFIQLPFRSICTSSASLFVEWRMKNGEEGERKLGWQNVSWKRSLAQINKLQPGSHYIFFETRRSDCTIHLCGSGWRSFSTPSLLEFPNCSWQINRQ